jgi:hypothetical protein
MPPSFDDRLGKPVLLAALRPGVALLYWGIHDGRQQPRGRRKSCRRKSLRQAVT